MRTRRLELPPGIPRPAPQAGASTIPPRALFLSTEVMIPVFDSNVNIYRNIWLEERSHSCYGIKDSCVRND